MHVKARIFVFIKRHTGSPFQTMSKRQRTNTQPQRRAKRPIDKKLINVGSAGLTNAEVAVDIYPAASFPGTITGLRWEIAFMRNTGAGVVSSYRWAIIVVPAGTAVNTMSMTSASSLYDPEQMVLAFGCGTTPATAQAGAANIHTGSTKSMRKLKAGDKLTFIALADNAAATIIFNGTIQFFYKT